VNSLGVPRATAAAEIRAPTSALTNRYIALGEQIVGRSSESRPETVESLVQPVTAAI